MGAGGFIGRHLVEFLRGAHAVTAFVRPSAEANRGAVRVDLTSPKVPALLHRTAERLGRPDVVFHLASLQPGPYAPMDYVSANVGTLAGALAYFRDVPPRRFIFTSTLSVYGRPDRNPVREDAAARPVHAYAASKLAAEGLLGWLADRCQVTILRLPSVFGPGQADSFVDGLAKTALRHGPIALFGRGRLLRDALHVRDVVRLCGLCLRRPVGRGPVVVNVGSGRPATNRDYARRLIELLKSRSRITSVAETPPAMFGVYANISRARRLLGFHPMTLDESLRLYAHELRA